MQSTKEQPPKDGPTHARSKEPSFIRSSGIRHAQEIIKQRQNGAEPATVDMSGQLIDRIKFLTMQSDQSDEFSSRHLAMNCSSVLWFLEPQEPLRKNSLFVKMTCPTQIFRGFKSPRECLVCPKTTFGELRDTLIKGEFKGAMIGTCFMHKNTFAITNYSNEAFTTYMCRDWLLYLLENFTAFYPKLTMLRNKPEGIHSNIDWETIKDHDIFWPQTTHNATWALKNGLSALQTETKSVTQTAAAEGASAGVKRSMEDPSPNSLVAKRPCSNAAAKGPPASTTTLPAPPAPPAPSLTQAPKIQAKATAAKAPDAVIAQLVESTGINADAFSYDPNGTIAVNIAKVTQSKPVVHFDMDVRIMYDSGGISIGRMNTGGSLRTPSGYVIPKITCSKTITNIF